jgi:hypothetical protein
LQPQDEVAVHAIGEIRMKIISKDFRVEPGEKVTLREWPTIVKPICKS